MGQDEKIFHLFLCLVPLTAVDSWEQFPPRQHEYQPDGSRGSKLANRVLKWNFPPE